jgi:glycosyltransferase involved in cell wall biosynthesis
MKRVLVIITNPKQASYRLRIAALRPGLLERGFELEVEVWPDGWLARPALLRRAANYHATILQRRLLDGSHARLLRASARNILYDIDDAVMVNPQSAGLLSRWKTRRRFNATAAIVDHVVAGNDHLAGMFKKSTVLPTCVDPKDYQVKRHESGGPVTLVWVGSHSTLPYLRQQLPAIEQAAELVPGIKLLTIADERIEHAKLPLEHVRWSKEEESEALARGDIGIAPTPDDEWTRGKCGFKIIQYMAAGLPVIASPVGANAQIVAPETGLLATTRREWSEAIVKLAGDIAVRRSMGRAGRERLEKNYSLGRAVDVWAELLAE